MSQELRHDLRRAWADVLAQRYGAKVDTSTYSSVLQTFGYEGLRTTNALYKLYDTDGLADSVVNIFPDAIWHNGVELEQHDGLNNADLTKINNLLASDEIIRQLRDLQMMLNLERYLIIYPLRGYATEGVFGSIGGSGLYNLRGFTDILTKHYQKPSQASLNRANPIYGQGFVNAGDDTQDILFKSYYANSRIKYDMGNNPSRIKARFLPVTYAGYGRFTSEPLLVKVAKRILDCERSLAGTAMGHSVHNAGICLLYTSPSPRD